MIIIIVIYSKQGLDNSSIVASKIFKDDSAFLKTYVVMD